MIKTTMIMAIVKATPVYGKAGLTATNAQGLGTGEWRYSRITIRKMGIRESVDSLCRDETDAPIAF